MARDHTPISRPELLARILEAAGTDAQRIAVELLDLASDIRAGAIPAHRAISIRLPVPQMEYSGWLTLYVVSEAGTIYVNWLDRWADAGASPALAVEYEDGLKDILGVKQVKFNPSSYKNAVPLELAAPRLADLRSLIKSTAATLARQVGSRDPDQASADA